jgi:hypothetical protein
MRWNDASARWRHDAAGAVTAALVKMVIDPRAPDGWGRRGRGTSRERMSPTEKSSRRSIPTTTAPGPPVGSGADVRLRPPRPGTSPPSSVLCLPRSRSVRNGETPTAVVRDHGVVTDSISMDAYGLTSGVLGQHTDEFFGAVGRVVCVCAVLEGQITTLRHTLAGARQGQFTQQPVKAQIDTARTLAHRLPGAAATVLLVYHDEETDAFSRRNDLAHSSFPAQPDGRIWGHRPARDRTVTDGRAETVETSVEAIQEFIGELCVLVGRFNQVHVLAASSARSAAGAAARP